MIYKQERINIFLNKLIYPHDIQHIIVIVQVCKICIFKWMNNLLSKNITYKYTFRFRTDFSIASIVKIEQTLPLHLIMKIIIFVLEKL